MPFGSRAVVCDLPVGLLLVRPRRLTSPSEGFKLAGLHDTMPRSLLMTGFIFGSTSAAWLRFDAGSVALSWIVMLICIAAMLAGALLQYKRAPQLALPPEVQELGSRDHLTSEEEERFADALRAWHRQNQREAWLEIQRDGPGSLIRPRAAIYYFWLSIVAVAVLPPTLVPSALIPQLPRFAVVLLPVAAAALAVAVSLGLRDWRRVLQSLDSGTDT